MARSLFGVLSGGVAPLSSILVVILCLTVQPVEALQTITGLVVNAESSQPLPAVQVFIETLDLGVLSQGNGRYNIQNVPAGTHTLTVQRIGFREQTVQVTVGAGATVEVDFRLQAEPLQLDEIIVTGTAGGSQRRAIGNVVEQINAADIGELPTVNSIENLLSGRVPGVTILGDAGSPGEGKQIRIRGVSSVGLPGDPIIYVDGVRINSERRDVGRYSAMSRLNDFNMNDIESIEVIKGPAAATLYGTEASDGVIQIITKRGQAGAPVFTVAADVGTVWMPDKYPARTTKYTPDPVRCPIAPCADGTVVAVNLVESERALGNPDIFNHGLTQSYNVAVRGGTDLIRYSASLSRSDTDGIFDWTWDERNSARTNVQIIASERLSFSLSGGFSRGERAPPGFFWAQNFVWGGGEDTVFDTSDDSFRGFWNPQEKWDSRLHTETHSSERSTWSLTTDFQVTDWLSHRLTFGSDQLVERYEEFHSRQGPTAIHWGSAGRIGRKIIGTWDLPVYTLDFSGTATFRFNDDQLGTATSYGVQYYERTKHFHESRGENFSIGGLSTVGAASIVTGNETFEENKTLGIYFQEQFDWDNRIFVTGAIRIDDNSAFGTDFDVVVYPKLSATWVLHEEDFWNVDWVDQLRLRMAWGQAGKQPDTFAASRLFRPETGPNKSPIFTPTSFGNPLLGPEKGSEIELGFDADLWSGRVGVNFTYFDRTTKDAIVTKTVPPSLWQPRGSNAYAGATQFVNIGQISAWGTETLLIVRPLMEGPVLWDVSVAFTTLGNLVDDMGGQGRIQVGRTRAHLEGWPIASLSDKRVVSADFISGDRGSVTNIMCDGGTGKMGLEFGGPPVPCDDAPQLFWGNSQPKWLVSLNSTLTLFENWRAGILFDAQGGYHMSSEYLGARMGSRPGTADIWLQNDPIYMGYFRVTENGPTYHKGGFAKLREVSLVYVIPNAIAESIGATRATIGLGVRNLAILWEAQKSVFDVQIIDQEMKRGNEQYQGESSGDFPPLSSWTLRLNLTF